MDLVVHLGRGPKKPREEMGLQDREGRDARKGGITEGEREAAGTTSQQGLGGVAAGSLSEALWGPGSPEAEEGGRRRRTDSSITQYCPHRG